jgi:hypothetical protein
LHLPLFYIPSLTDGFMLLLNLIWREGHGPKKKIAAIVIASIAVVSIILFVCYFICRSRKNLKGKITLTTYTAKYVAFMSSKENAIYYDHDRTISQLHGHDRTISQLQKSHNHNRKTIS